MSHQFAMLNLLIACHSLMPQNSTNNYVIINGTSKASNPLAMLQLYIVCRSLVPQNFTSNDITDAVPALPKLAINLPEGYTVFPSSRVAYKFYKVKKTWLEARIYCAEEGANLAVTDSIEKIQRVASFNEDRSTSISVGIHRSFAESNEWVEIKTGSPLSTIPWASNANITDQSYKCGAIRSDRTGLYAVSCTFDRYFVCEISI